LLGFNGRSVNGADMFFDNGNQYIMITPSNTTGAATGYMVNYYGCLLYQFDSIGASSVTNQQALAWIIPSDYSFSGACTFSSTASIGVVMDVLFFPPVQNSNFYTMDYSLVD